MSACPCCGRCHECGRRDHGEWKCLYPKVVHPEVTTTQAPINQPVLQPWDFPRPATRPIENV